jgi:Acyclic terpene utilisation family protein AtuA
MKTIRIGNGSAYWGDMLDPAVELAERGELDYLGLDHLSELTLAILQRMKAKNPEAGYIPDLIPWTEALLPLTHRNGVRMITNAGGANPAAGAARVLDLARRLGFRGLRIGIVSGDDVFPELDRLAAEGVPFTNLDTGEEGLARIRRDIVAANAYIGSEAIVDALAGGAEVVVTGRVSDSALSVGPILHEFGWTFEDPNWDRIGAAITVGHIIECACFCTGGGSSQWRDAAEAWHIGFPIAEFAEDATAVITKPSGSGGIVNQWTVKEQLTYEVTDPGNYLMPDGTADLREVRVEEIGKDRVRVSHMRGGPRPDTLKVCIGYRDGWIAEGLVLYSWPDALAKAQRSEEIVRRRLRNLGLSTEELRFDYVGINTLHGPTAPMPAEDLNEVGLRIAARCRTQEEADGVRREATHLWTLGGAGTAFGVPFQPRPVIALWPALVPRDAVHVTMVTQTA